MLKQALVSMLKSPPTERRNRVLANVLDVIEVKERDNASITSDYSNQKEETLTNKEKANKLVEQRDRKSPTGHFVLGTYRPLGNARGYGEYLCAQGMRGK